MEKQPFSLKFRQTKTGVNPEYYFLHKKGAVQFVGAIQESPCLLVLFHSTRAVRSGNITFL
jgi:hypothetical protein